MRLWYSSWLVSSSCCVVLTLSVMAPPMRAVMELDCAVGADGFDDLNARPEQVEGGACEKDS